MKIFKYKLNCQGTERKVSEELFPGNSIEKYNSLIRLLSGKQISVDNDPHYLRES